MNDKVIARNQQQWNAFYDRKVGRGYLDYDRGIEVKIKQLLLNKKCKDIIDIGSGSGELVLKLRKDLKVNAVGIDISDRIVSWLNNQIRVTVTNKKTKQKKEIKIFKQLDINRKTVKVKDREIKMQQFLKRFQCVIINKTLEHIEEGILDKIHAKDQLCIVVLSLKEGTFKRKEKLLLEKGFRQAEEEDLPIQFRGIKRELLKQIYLRGEPKHIKKKVLKEVLDKEKKKETIVGSR